MADVTKRAGIVLGVAAAALVACAAPAAAEFEIGAYFGWNGSLDSDVHYTNAGTGDEFTLHDVPWLGLSFSGDGGAPYYGARGTWWFESLPNWGVMLDYTHAKVRADPNATVATSGSGTGITDPMIVGDAFDVLEFTDGISLVTLNAVYRMDPVGSLKLRPYVGLGGGLAIPHTEVLRAGDAPSNLTFEYQIAGWSAQVLAGFSLPVYRNISAFGEYKLSYASIDETPLADGGELSTDLITNHLLFGLSASFGGK